MSSDAIRYRWLDKAELCLVDSTIADHGWMTLNEDLSRILVAEQDDTILGFIVLQLTPQVGPLYLHPEVRGGAVATELAKRMKDYMNDVQCRGYFSIADSPHVAKICESQGMARLDSPVFVSIPETGKEAT